MPRSPTIAGAGAMFSLECCALSRCSGTGRKTQNLMRIARNVVFNSGTKGPRFCDLAGAGMLRAV